MIIEIKIAPENSVLLIMDPDYAEIPKSMGGNLVASTSSCIAVRTLSAQDGETSVMLTDEIGRVDGLHSVFTGTLVTPGKEVNVSTVLLRIIAKMRVSEIQNRVEIWVNNENAPSEICVLVRETGE